MEDYEKNELLESIYFDPVKSASYTSIEKLYKAVKDLDIGSSITKKYVKQWLEEQDAYTLHKPTIEKVKRGKIITKGLRDLFEADLMDVSNVSDENDDITFILVVIDAFSRELWLEPLRSKEADDVIKGFEKILERSGTPKRLRSDAGKEFTNLKIKKWFDENDIKFYLVQNESKASIAERVIRTLRKKFRRHMSYKQSTRYLDILQDIVKSYNNTYHRTIKMKPADVNDKNEFKLWMRLYMPIFTKAPRSARLKVGDRVRVSKLRRTFSRGYEEGWSEEVFKIDKILHSAPTRYLLKDLLDEDITGSFYEEELQKVPKPDYGINFNIDKVLQRRTRNKRKEVLVSWKGYPEKFNQWIPAKDVIDL